MWSVMDGATKPYTDVFTGVFWRSLPSADAAELQSPERQIRDNKKAS